MKPMHEIENMFDADYYRQKREARRAKNQGTYRTYADKNHFNESYYTEIIELDEHGYMELSVNTMTGAVDGHNVVVTSISTYVNEKWDNRQVNIFVDGVQVAFFNVGYMTPEATHSKLWRKATKIVRNQVS